jgi:hypothetical protein
VNLRTALRLACLLLGLLAAGNANAACSSPAGNTGDQIYASNYNTMVFCDGARWVSMAGGVSVTVNTSGGGGATPAGSSADVQFNSSGALAADTGNFTYSSGLLKAPNVSTTNVAASGLGTFGSLLVNGGATISGQASITTISTTLMNFAPSYTTVTNLSGGSGNMIASGSTVVSTSSAGSITLFTNGMSRLLVGNNGYVGISTTNPGTNLDVDGGIRATQRNTAPTGAGIELNYTPSLNQGQLYSYDRGAGKYRDLDINDLLYVSTTAYLGGKVGIGNSAPSYILDVGTGSLQTGIYVNTVGYVRSNGTIGRAGVGSATVGNPFNIYWTGSAAQLWIDSANIGNITVSSDRRVKKDITPLRKESGLAVLERMTPVSFHWKNSESGTKLQYGFIAQDMAKVLPEIVSNTGLKTKETPDGLLRIDYNGLFAPIVKAVQDLKLESDARYKELKADNDNLRAELKATNASIRAIQAQLKSATTNR